jgi:hypothetical protein
VSDPASIPAGVWEHRNGGRYLVIGVGRFDDDDDLVVIYIRLYGREAGGLPTTVRRAADFLAPVEWPDGSTSPRFRFLGEVEPEQNQT